MADAMVVARMPQEKKDSVALKLAKMGTNASRAINDLYDYIDAHGSLPFATAQSAEGREEAQRCALAWIKGMDRLPEGNCFQDCSDEEITRMRLRSRGFEV